MANVVTHRMHNFSQINTKKLNKIKYRVFQKKFFTLSFFYLKYFHTSYTSLFLSFAVNDRICVCGAENHLLIFTTR